MSRFELALRRPPAAEQVGELGVAGLGQFQISAVALHMGSASR
jgi:hypothetical protein